MFHNFICFKRFRSPRTSEIMILGALVRRVARSGGQFSSRLGVQTGGRKGGASRSRPPVEPVYLAMIPINRAKQTLLISAV